MYVLYELSTGRAHSQSAESFTNPNEVIYGIKQTNKTGIWNQSTLDFDPYPTNKKMATLDFMELFTDEELIDILDAAKVNTQVQLFIMKMEQAEFIDRAYPPTINGVNKLEEFTLIGVGRAAEVLNG